MDKKLKLTENQLNDLIKESVERILKESTTDSDDIEKWDFLKEQFGADDFIDEIYNVLDDVTIHDIIEYIFKMHDLGDDSEEEQEEF
jgi:hypothetical protein